MEGALGTLPLDLPIAVHDRLQDGGERGHPNPGADEDRVLGAEDVGRGRPERAVDVDLQRLVQLHLFAGPVLRHCGLHHPRGRRGRGHVRGRLEHALPRGRRRRTIKVRQGDPVKVHALAAPGSHTPTPARRVAIFVIVVVCQNGFGTSQIVLEEAGYKEWERILTNIYSPHRTKRGWADAACTGSSCCSRGRRRRRRPRC